MSNYLGIKNSIMRYGRPIFFSIVTFAFVLYAFIPRPQEVEKEAVLIRAILSYLSQLHYQPKSVDDNFSADLYHLYLERLDGSRRFLNQKDIAQLEPYKNQLDDQAGQGTFEFFDLSSDLLEKGIEKAKAFSAEILQSPIPLNQNKEIELDPDKRGYAKDDAELKAFWKDYLQYQVLLSLEEKTRDNLISNLDSLEQDSRNKVQEIFDGYFTRIQKIRREDRLSLYLNCITNIFDPHSTYMKPFDKEQFNIRMSGKFEGIGARLSSDGETTRVAEIIVGGAAWRQKDLEKNDIVLKVQQEDSTEAKDIAGMVLDDVVQLIRGPKGTKVTLTVKKVSGDILEIPIVRDVVELEETFAKSLILEGEQNGEQYGYIYLPSFYADFNDRNGRFCSDDVENEIEKLKAANVSGIILDLRYNGGGALYEVVDMSGLFIEKGPIVQVKNRRDEAEIIEDKDPSVAYDGPLVVMVNSGSASASEILTAALQDYNRALIVGSKSTFGKGTVQRPYDLDRSMRGNEDIKPLGAIKLTTQKFYRINGGSVQLKGVTPDIILPDSYHYIETGEREDEFAMNWSEIDPVPFNQSVYTLQNKELVIKNSNERIANHPVFKDILTNATWLKTQEEATVFPLDLEKLKQYEKDRRGKAEAFKKSFETVFIENIYNIPSDLTLIESDESKKARNEEWIKAIKGDIYIAESLNILKDLVTIQN
ncbi:MAG: hypothetical protein RLZZ248_682 [Bacteroidota bacterium]|jgi:carboxyl-terminal processing protease